MLAGYAGNDISKLIPQLQKLEVSLPEGSSRITADLIEKNVGISKDYNNFELLNAIIEKKQTCCQQDYGLFRQKSEG